MKKILAIVLSLAVLAAMLLSGFTVSMAEEESDYVTFTAQGNDPYANFKFSEAGKNKTIDPDNVTWAAVRYRTVSEVDSKGVPYKAQFYISPAAEPCIPVYYEFTGGWETLVVDLTSVSESTELDSIWDSGTYTNTSYIRFDPLESDRDSEANDNSSEYGFVIPGDSIDVAWIAFFEKEEDARAYTGKEDTPYCILDAASLSKPSSANLLEARRYTDGVAEATPEPKIVSTGSYPLYDTTFGTSTGYWVNPAEDGDILELVFEIPDWFVGFSFFAYCAENETIIDIEIYDDNSNLAWSGRNVCLSNAGYEIALEKTLPPGWYTFDFVYSTNPDLPEDTAQWFVLGSGQPRDDLDPEDIEITGFKGNNSLGAPQIVIFLGEADPNYATPEPTEPPTVKPTEPPTNTPEPEPTEVPVTEPTEAPKATEAPKNNGCNNVIGGGMAIIGIAALAAVVIRKKH